MILLRLMGFPRRAFGLDLSYIRKCLPCRKLSYLTLFRLFQRQF